MFCYIFIAIIKNFETFKFKLFGYKKVYIFNLDVVLLLLFLFPTSRPSLEILLLALQVLDGYWVGVEGEWEDGRQAGGWVVGGEVGKEYWGGEGVGRSIF